MKPTRWEWYEEEEDLWVWKFNVDPDEVWAYTLYPPGTLGNEQWYLYGLESDDGDLDLPADIRTEADAKAWVEHQWSIGGFK